MEVTAIAYFNAGLNLTQFNAKHALLTSKNISEPNSTLEQTSLNAVGRDSVPELGLREVNIVLKKKVLGRRRLATGSLLSTIGLG